MSIPNTPDNNATPAAAPEDTTPVVVDAPAAALVAAAPAATEAPVAAAAPAAAPQAYTVPAPAAPAASYAAPAPTAAPAVPETSDSNTLSITSFVLGLCSIVLGWTFVAPIIGLVLGIMARKREPRSRAFANWGIGLNAAMLVLSAMLIILFFVFAAFFLPFIIASSDGYMYMN